MTKFRHARTSLIAAVLGLSAVPALLPVSALADTAAEAKTADVVRPEISAPIIAARALFDAKNIPGALAKLAETDAVANKTPYEVFAIERTRGDYYNTAGDKANAAKSFEAVIAVDYLKNPDKLNMMQAISLLYFQAQNYPLAISWGERYFKEGGTDARAKDVMNRSYFLNKDFAQAYKGFDQLVTEELAAGRVPDQQKFQILLNCMDGLKDKAGTLKALERLNTYYPAANNWTYLIAQVHSKPGFSEHLYLDVFRLKQELGLMKTAEEYADMSELAKAGGLPAEAKKALELGFAAGLMDKGPDAKKYAAMRDAATRRAAEDLKTMDQGEASAGKSKDGAGLVNLGMAYATAGQFDKGASLIEQGISRGGVSRMEEAKLHLGLVYYWAGKKDEAIKQLSTVAGSDGTADLARYWIMQINHPLAK